MSQRRLQPLSVRRAPVRREGASTVDVQARTVDFVAATERRVRMWDYEHGEIDEVLLVKGAVLPGNRQIPLLDTHSRYGVDDVLGSARDIRVEGDQLVATAHFSAVPRADEALQKIAEGHLTDCSVGYRVSDYTTVKKGEKAVIGGRSWEGPVRVVTSWIPKELSVCPIGADEAAKARSDGAPAVSVEVNVETHTQRKEHDMTPEEIQTMIDKAVAAARAEQKAVPPRTPEDEAARVTAEHLAKLEEVRNRELQRIREIQDCEGTWTEMGFDFRTAAETAIRDRWEVKKFYQHCTELAKTQRGAGGAAVVPDGRIVITRDEREKFREYAVAGLCIRTGREKLVDEKLRTGHDLARLSLREMLQQSNRKAGLPADTMLSSRSIGASDMPYILGDYQNKIVQEGYAQANVTWRPWCKPATVSNLQTIHLPIVSAISKAPHISTNDGQYRYLQMSDAEETCNLLKSGGILRVSDRVILNDDTLAIQQSAEGVGDVCARAVNIDVYGDNTADDYGVMIGSGGVGETMRDSTALFTSGHSNYIGSGSGAVPSVATLSAAQAALRKQKDISSTYPLNWTPSFLIVPAALEGTSEQLLTSTFDPAKNNDARNPFFGRLQLVVEPLLDGGPTGAATRWYVAGPVGKTVWVFFHESTNDRPVVEQQAGWYVDGMEWKAHIYHKAKAADWRGLFCNYGA